MSTLLAPPANATAEAVALGFLLSVKNPLIKLHEYPLSPDDFFSESNAAIYSILADQFSKGRDRADTVQLDRRMAKVREYKELGGKDYLQSIISSHLGERKAKEAAKLVKDLSRRRAIILGLSEQVTKAHDQAEPLDSIVSGVNATLAGTVDQQAAKRIADQRTVATEAMDEISVLLDGPGHTIGIPTDIRAFNYATSGFYPGDYYILAARPGTGKTALALSFAATLAQAGHPVLFFSLEMPRVQLMKRLLASHLGIDASKFRGTIPFTDWEKDALYSPKADAISRWPIHYYDFASVTGGEFRTICHVEKERHGIQFIVVDYIGKMKPDRRGLQRHLEIAEVSESIRAVSKELKIPVLALAQMNRSIEQSNREPQLSDLRESGSLEQDADTVIFLHENQDETPPDGMKAIYLKIAKNRHGPERQIKMLFDRKVLRFIESSETPREQMDDRRHWQDGQE